MSGGRVRIDLADLRAAVPRSQTPVDVDRLVQEEQDLADRVGLPPRDEPLPQLTVESGSPSDIDFQTEFGAAFKLGQVGVLDRLRQRFPDRAVVPRKNDAGEIDTILIAEPDQGETPIDQQRFREFNIGALANAGPTGIKAGTGIVGSAVGAGVPIPGGALLGGALGDATGNAIVQSLDQFLFSGDSRATPEERLVDAGVDVGLGLAIPTAAAGAQRLGKRALEGLGVETQERALREANRMLGEGGQEATERTARARSEGVDLTIGQATRNQENLAREANLAQAEGSRGVMSAAESQQVRQVADAVGRLIQRVGTDDSAQAGVRVARAVRAGRQEIQRRRSREFSKRLDRANALSRDPETGQAGRIIPQDNARRVASQLLGEDRSVSPLAAGGDAVSSVLNRLRAGSERLNQPLTVKELQGEMSSLGKRLREIRNRPDAAYERRVLTQMLDARRADLAAAAEGSGGAAGTLLKEARDLYGEYSQQLERINTPLLRRAQKLVDDSSPEKTVERLLGRGTTVTESRQVADVLHQADPGALQNVQASVIGEMFRKASSPARGGFSPDSFRTQFFTGQNRAKLKALFKFDREGFKQLEKIATIADDISPNVGTRSRANPSGTAGVVIGFLTQGAGDRTRRLISELPVVRGFLDPSKGNEFLAQMVTDPVARRRVTNALAQARRNPRRGLPLIADALAKFAATGGENVAAEQDVIDFEGVNPGVEIDVPPEQPPTIPLENLRDLRGPRSPRSQPRAAAPRPQPRQASMLERLSQ